jgi:hypothetical protein
MKRFVKLCQIETAACQHRTRQVELKVPGTVWSGDKCRPRKLQAFELCRANFAPYPRARQGTVRLNRRRAGRADVSDESKLLKLIEIHPRNPGVVYFKVHRIADLYPIAQVSAHSDRCSRLSSQQYRVAIVFSEDFLEK